MVRESLPLAVYSFFTIFYLSLDVLMIEYIMGDPKYVAPYGYASLLIEGINMLLTGYIIAVYPTFSRLFEQNEAAYQRLFRMSFNLLLAATIPASVLLSFWSYGWMNFIRETGTYREYSAGADAEFKPEYAQYPADYGLYIT